MFSWDHSRFNSYSAYFKREFGARVQKLTLDAGFTCPNRDGTLGHGGCSFCNNEAFNPSYCHADKPIGVQLQEGIEFHRQRYRRASKYLAYFQAYTNTYAPLDQLVARYREALAFPEVIGLVIGTRPDCVTTEMLDYFADLQKECYLVIEYGVESYLDRTLSRVNRGHDFACSRETIGQTHARGIKAGAHMILGLPGESRDEILAGAAVMGALPLHSIKLHQLQILKGTMMEQEYKENPSSFFFPALADYIDLVIDYLELLNPAILIERVAGEVPPRFLAGPGFGLIRNDQIIMRLEKRLQERDTWQGRLWRV